MNYEIKGGSLPVVELHLTPGESIKCEKGAMVWMSQNMQMETSGGGIGKMFSKAISGESMFHNIYKAVGQEGMITFGTNFPGSILPVEIGPGKEIICQKSAFLACTPGVNMEIFYQKKLGAGFFGGEGFIMQKFTGQGIVFLEIDGTAINYDLKEREVMVIDTGYLAMMSSTCSMDIVSVKGGIKNSLLGGEGFFNTQVTGPGTITLQTMPKNCVADALRPFFPTNN